MTTYTSLLVERQELEALIAGARKTELEAIKAKVAEFGFTQEEVFPVRLCIKEYKPVPMKYTDGVNQWSGRGKTPLWVSVAKDNGTFREL